MPPSQHEYYIRQPSDTDARGPFTIEQLSRLAESGGLNSSTLHFDANTDQWISLFEVPELAALLPKNTAKNSALPAASSPLAAKLTVVLLAGSALALLLPMFKSVDALNANALLQYPCFWLGALDLLMALCCGVFGARFFRFVRVRTGLGLGFLGALFWLQANTGALVAALIASVCLWLATTCAAPRALIANTIAGLAALAALAYCLLT
ncbi:DUF4339 domain-containing protein [Ereboglobus luteus]|uniref:GYF domain-containing protein n=1 Tax=Ereboglobus luteus TaxID=1796921 RepID=A0A2U8DZU0_9BACT|nr:DUF4339 domain-containing protein [Ereboglobus luteus]AWI08106.1 hypothetical protein CKA38_01480 [Ereboglobus luteus]